MDCKDESEPIRILNIVPNMKAAGVETFIMNIYRNIDRNKVQFDFIVHNEERKFYDDEIEKMGGKIYRFSFKDDKKIFKYINDLKKFFKEHKEYKIIHGHMQSMMPLYLKIAKEQNVPIRIAHSHNNSYEKSLKGIILHFFSKFSRIYSNINFACSKAAGKYLFRNKQFEIINNGIELEKFYFDMQKRRNIRKQLKIKEDEIIIGNIGRMEKQKNQLFLLDVFNECCKKNTKMKLLIIGEGSQKTLIQDRIKKYKIEDKIILLDNVRNVNEIMQGIDVFTMPSLYEGLGIVLIEAQISGLKCYATKNNIAQETQITPNIDYLPLKKEIWVDKVLNTKFNYSRIIEKEMGKEFDIRDVAKQLEEKYISLLRNEDM